jgi:hypothetical protein
MLSVGSPRRACQWNPVRGVNVQAPRSKQGNGRSSLYATLNGKGSDRSLSYSQVSGSLLSECVARVTDRGDAVLFGRTTDGGALSIHVLAGGEATKFYVTDASELMELLQGLIAAVDAAS